MSTVSPDSSKPIAAKESAATAATTVMATKQTSVLTEFGGNNRQSDHTPLPIPAIQDATEEKQCTLILEPWRSSFLPLIVTLLAFGHAYFLSSNNRRTMEKQTDEKLYMYLFLMYLITNWEYIIFSTLCTMGSAESALKSFISGGVGGVCVVLVGHPLDLIKVRMQTGTSAGTSVLGMLATTFRNEGVLGLYRGVSAPLTAVTPMFAVSFWAYDMGQRLVRSATNVKGDLTLTQKCIAGGLSALPTTVLMAPSERIKCLLQTAKPGQYSGMLDCATQVYRSGGITSVYRGTVLTLWRDVPGSVAWFGTYEAVKLGMMQWQGMTDSSQLSPLAVLSAGGFAGMACWTVSMPADVLKSRFQTAPDGTYRGGMDILTRLLKEEGFGALFTGIRPALIRAFPANAACFFGMEVSRKMLAFMD